MIMRLFYPVRSNVICAWILCLWIFQPVIAEELSKQQPPEVKSPAATATGKRAATDPAPQNRHTWFKVSQITAITKESAAKLLARRAYYILPADRVCTANNRAHTRLKTWRNKISFNEQGELLLWDTVCNDSPELVPWTALEDKLLVSTDLNQINYAGNVFTYAEKPPLLCPTGLWCPVDK